MAYAGLETRRVPYRIRRLTRFYRARVHYTVSSSLQVMLLYRRFEGWWGGVLHSWRARNDGVGVREEEMASPGSKPRCDEPGLFLLLLSSFQNFDACSRSSSLGCQQSADHLELTKQWRSDLHFLRFSK